MTSTRSILHRDGTVTVWSVYTQTWHRHVAHVGDADQAALSAEERGRVQAHLAASRQGATSDEVSMMLDDEAGR
jgi:hypothetical protein